MTTVMTISGQAQHGKDTFARFMKEEFERQGKTCLIVHLADYLKFVCKEYFGWDGNKDAKGRTLLQVWGTDIGRKRNENVWTNVIIELLQTYAEDFDFVLIPDTRFKNEIFLLDCYFDIRTINIVRNGFDNGLTEEQKNHPSERDLDGFEFDIIINNESDLTHLTSIAGVFCSYFDTESTTV